MRTVLVQPPWSRDPSTLVELAPGEHLTWGRGAQGLDVGMRLEHPGVSRQAGEIIARPSFWLVSNHSRTSTFVIENAEAAGEYLTVGPRRAGMPVPFEISRVLVPAGTDTIAFRVFAPAQPSVLDLDDGPGGAGTATTASFPLDETAKYFLVLVALCEPRLRGDALASLPTAAQVARRLRPLPGCADLTARAVDFHVDYLARAKLRMTAGDHGSGFAGRREAVVTFSLRFGLVLADHLEALPPRRSCEPDG
jgi:hypothetical protein